MTPEYALPEFTRSLRALAVPSAPGSDHDVAFAPLLEARRIAHRATTVEQQVGAFDAVKLERQFRQAILSLAERKHAQSAPDRRALGAELELLAAPLWRELEALRAAAAAVQGREAWDAWVAQVQRVFRAADDWWEAALAPLADPRGRRGAFWRRVLGGTVR